ncbi:MAG: DUF1801 domain-containing protein [Deferribacteres bacterium]|nr:DUF1801 domain-containing protein [candidate division KSB1 bacterium]MCB9500889.1 DUF1801 domain-containing protein [Deferribacteres bacterium]
MKENKSAPQTIDEYIGNFPPEIQEILEKIRQTIRETAPEAKEKISYQIPTFTLNGNLVHFAGYKTHIGFYPAPSGIEKFDKEVADYKTGKGTLQFPLDKSIPYKLIKRIVKFRISENLNKTHAKKR